MQSRRPDVAHAGPDIGASSNDNPALDMSRGTLPRVIAMDEQTAERVREIIAAIPPGRVLAYGDVAARAGLRSARQVGRLLAEDGHDVPWHRVLRADGTPAPQIAAEQLARLRAEGVLARDGRIDMRRYRQP